MTKNNGITLSLIICSRNDNYMGDPMWRLATSINFVCQQIYALNKQHCVEIVVTDWGSVKPIAEVIALDEKAASITRFIQVPSDMANELQKDSPFGEVYALNIAARRSHGQYIGRIDQDTLVTKAFLEHFFHATENKNSTSFDIENSYMFAARKQLPFGLVKKKPNLQDLEFVISQYKHLIFSEELPYCYWASAVGILIMHRKVWNDTGGFDERLIYYWFMDIDLATRLKNKYPIVNIGKIFGYHFYHLEHIITGFKLRHSHRKLNPEWSKSFNKPVLNPNGHNWGLGSVSLTEVRTESKILDSQSSSLQILASTTVRIRLYAQILYLSSKQITYTILRHIRYFSKRLLQKPYL
jgi:hypothetical protein